jgi:hypothetical protein
MYSVVVYRDEVIEVDYAFAEYLGMVTSKPRGDRIFTAHEWFIDVEVYIASRHTETQLPNLENSTPVDYSEWFLDNLEFAVRWEPRVINVGDWIMWKERGREVFWHDTYYWMLLPESIPRIR